MALLVSQTYAGVFLNAADLAPLGQRYNAVIHAVAAEEVGQEKRQRVVLDLVTPAGKAWKKRVVLNKTNSMQLAAAFGDDATSWPGRQIEIWAENVMLQGRWVPGVKMQPAGNGTAPPPTAAAPPIPDGAPASAAGSDLDDKVPF